VADIKVLDADTPVSVDAHKRRDSGAGVAKAECPAGRTLIPSWEKHGGTAELSSSASLRRMGNFSTADMGMSPR
jgi:hypothetical protein